MSIQEAIEKAIEGGWYIQGCVPKKVGFIEEYESNFICENKNGMSVNVMHPTASIFLDPSFWRSLGKEMGWEKENVITNSVEYLEWKGHWHRFIDYLAEGKSIEDYFKEL